MKSLMIEDLGVAKELDGRAMSAVRGGTGYLLPLPYYSPVHVTDTTNFSAQQLISQSNSIVNNTGNDVAFASGIHSTVNPSQSAKNTINF
ncbi:hypothetical protein C9I57_21225 [Trinickia symbiotica]|uniref:Uncharacterized protein n=1 Tax=Trinickia symbiotica TaxID=863227 RepID=A0A2T3XPV3_9BURK|nr:hypothetical protein [Trinickia symbiotica]PTB18556.1 hypothetical protein C9I57_21225 [Trinickia symbiotica]